jgi:hypothetical protein
MQDNRSGSRRGYERKEARQLPCFFSSAGSLRRHSTAWAWQAIPILEHMVLEASRRQVTQRSVHSAHPGGCAWTAGSFAGTGGLPGAFGTISADGNVGLAEQFAHSGGGSAAWATTIALTATAITSEPQRMRASDNDRGNIVSPHPCAAMCDNTVSMLVKGSGMTNYSAFARTLWSLADIRCACLLVA